MEHNKLSLKFGNYLASISFLVLLLALGVLINDKYSTTSNALAYAEEEVRGTLDAATCDIVGGWAYNSNNPDGDFYLRLDVDGKHVMNVPTPGFRPDVNAAFGISGNHGFTLSTPIYYLDGIRHKVEVRAYQSGLLSNISNSPKYIECPYPPSELIKCGTINGLKICHNKDDESALYQTPVSEVAYNMQIIRDGQNYYYIYHGGPKDLPAGSTGDSIRVAVTNSYNYRLPYTGVPKIWGSRTDTVSRLYSGSGVSGGGNPMVIAGKPGDPYYYLFFITVAKDSPYSQEWRHHLGQARTKDFDTFEIRTTENGQDLWYPFSELSCSARPDLCRPAAIKDVSGNELRSNHHTRDMHNTAGLIGSMVYHNGLYYYFYTDTENPPESELSYLESYNLYFRTTTDVANNSTWSAPHPLAVRIGDVMRGVDMIRIARAKDLNRWVMLKSCGHSICIRYTIDDNLAGEGGLDHFMSKPFFNLDLKARNLRAGGGFSQPFWMTDKYGKLTSPDFEPQDYKRGGEIYWSDFDKSNCYESSYAGCPVYGGDVWRAGWTLEKVI